MISSFIRLLNKIKLFAEHNKNAVLIPFFLSLQNDK